MKLGFFRGLILLVTGLLLSVTPQLRADVEVYWDFDNGFYPSTAVINPGETVIWWNIDPYGFGVQITIGGSLSFYLPDYTGQGVTFPYAGIYGFQSDFGDHGSVTVSTPPPPLLTLEFPRLANGQFLFEATGLSIGKTSVLMSSTNLTSWTAIQTNVADGSSLTFTNTASLGQCFFQVVEQP